MNPLRVRRGFPHELLARPGEFPQRLLRRRGHEARAHEPVRQQVCQPRGILHVALAAGDIPYRGGMREDQRQLLCRQHCPHGLPVDARRFEHGVRTALRSQPLP